MAIGDVDPAGESSQLSQFTRDYERLRLQKSRQHGGVEARILTNLAFYAGEQYLRSTPTGLVMPPLDQHKLFLVFNLIRKLVKRRIGRLSAIAPEFSAYPDTQDAKAYALADVVNKLLTALDQKLDQPMRSWEIYFWLVIAGVAIERTPWVPNASVEPMPSHDPETGQLLWTDRETGQIVPDMVMQAQVERGERTPESFTVLEELRSEGDVGSEIISPLAFFMDASVKSIRDLAPDQACYIAQIKTIGWIKDQFGDEVAAKAVSTGSDLSIIRTRLTQVGPTVAGTTLRDLVPTVHGTQGRDDPEMAVVLTRYQPPSQEWPTGRETFFVPGKVILHDRPNPYEDIPLTDYHFEPPATTFWTGDFMTDLIPAQKFANKRFSQLGEQANASIYDLILLGPELRREDIPTDYPGFVEDGIDENGNPMVVRLPGPSLPSWFLESIRFVIEYLQNVGASDILQTLPFLGQRRGVTDLPMIQEILDSEDGPVFQHLGTQLAAAKQRRLNRVKAFYPPVRTLHYTGASMRDEVLTFHASEVLRSGVDFTVTVDRDSLVPELHALRAARVQQELATPMALLYVNPRTGQLDASKIAKAMKYGEKELLDRETQHRKYAAESVLRVARGEAPLPIYPFHLHDAMMDEIESHMVTTEFVSASDAVQQTFFQMWQTHQQFLAQQAQAASQAMQNQQIQATIAQVSQQVAAKTAAEATEAAIDQLQAQRDQEQRAPMSEQIRAMLLEEQAETNGNRVPEPRGPRAIR